MIYGLYKKLHLRNVNGKEFSFFIKDFPRSVIVRGNAECEGRLMEDTAFLVLGGHDVSILNWDIDTQNVALPKQDVGTDLKNLSAIYPCVQDRGERKEIKAPLEELRNYLWSQKMEEGKLKPSPPSVTTTVEGPANGDADGFGP